MAVTSGDSVVVTCWHTVYAKDCCTLTCCAIREAFSHTQFSQTDFNYFPILSDFFFWKRSDPNKKRTFCWKSVIASFSWRRTFNQNDKEGEWNYDKWYQSGGGRGGQGPLQIGFITRHVHTPTHLRHPPKAPQHYQASLPVKLYTLLHQTLFTLSNHVSFVLRYALAHFMGWVGKALMIRDRSICWTISISWELIELSLTWAFPNFEGFCM